MVLLPGAPLLPERQVRLIDCCLVRVEGATLAPLDMNLDTAHLSSGSSCVTVSGVPSRTRWVRGREKAT